MSKNNGRVHNYTSINVKTEQHSKLKRIADFRGVKITELGIEMADQYISSFLEEYGDLFAKREELENQLASLHKEYRERVSVETIVVS